MCTFPSFLHSLIMYIPNVPCAYLIFVNAVFNCQTQCWFFAFCWLVPHPTIFSVRFWDFCSFCPLLADDITKSNAFLPLQIVGFWCRYIGGGGKSFFGGREGRIKGIFPRFWMVSRGLFRFKNCHVHCAFLNQWSAFRCRGWVGMIVIYFVTFQLSVV